MKVYPKKMIVFFILIIFLASVVISVSAASIKEKEKNAEESNNFFNKVDSSNNFFRKNNFLSFEDIDLFPGIKLKNFKVYTKWIGDNGTVFEKTSSITTSGGLVDVNDDSINDLKIVFDFGLKIVEIKDYDFTSLDFPFVLGFVTNVETVRTSEGCVEDFDFFEVQFQAGLPSFLGLEQKVFRIGGFRSDDGEKNPESFKTSHKFIPYLIRNLLGLNTSPEFWVSQDPGDLDDGIDYLIGVNEVETQDDPSLSFIVENKPAKSFDLKFKLGLNDDYRFKFDSREGIFDNISFSLVRNVNDKKIGGSFVFKNLDRVDFDADLNLKDDETSVSYFSRNNLDFDFKFFNEQSNTLLKTGVLWDKGKTFTAVLKKASGFSVDTNRVFGLHDLSFEKPGYKIKLDSVSSENSGFFDLSLNSLGFDVRSDIKLDFSNLGFVNNDFNLDVGTLKPSLAGLFSMGLNEEQRGFKVGGDVGLFVDDISFESFDRDLNIDVSGGIDVESGGWVDFYKTLDEVNHVELKLNSMAFEFSDVDFSFNKERLNLGGLFDFGEEKERLFHVQWKKPNLFKFEFDKDVGLTVSDFFVKPSTGWLVDRLDVKSFSWVNGRRFLVDVSDDGLLFETSSDLDLNDLLLSFKNGAIISSTNTFFKGAFQVEWFEEQLFFDVESNIDWDLKIDTPLFGVWDVNGLIEGDIQVNSNWIQGESGSLEFIADSDGILHDFIIEHKDLELHLGTVDLTPGNIVFDWKKGNNGYLELDNNGISASLDICSINHTPSLFSFEVGNIDLTPGDTMISWFNSDNLKHLLLDSGIVFDVDSVKLSQDDSVLEISSLGVQPGIFDFKWYKSDNRMELTNSINGFGPKVSLQKNNELFEASLDDLSSNDKTFTLEWYKNDGSITGFYIDTDDNKCANWVECSYNIGNNYGRKLSLTGLKADGFTIQNQDSTIYLGGKIGGSRLVYHDYRNEDWHMLTDTIWDINGDGLGYFSMECDPNWDIDISPLVLLSDYDIEIDSTVYAPSFFNLTWDFGLGPAHALIGLDTDGETIGVIDLDIHDSWWNIIIEGDTLAAEDFWLYWEFLEGIETGGTIDPASYLSIEIYIEGTRVFWFEYP